MKKVKNLILNQNNIRYAVQRKNPKYLRNSLLAIYINPFYEIIMSRLLCYILVVRFKILFETNAQKRMNIQFLIKRKQILCMDQMFVFLFP